MPEAAKIIYTKIDEAPALATHSLMPILRAFTKGSGIDLEAWDISLTGRIIANFPDNLTDEQRIPDYLGMLSELSEDPSANIIKLPNISASIPQLKGAIKELQDKGYDIPDYPRRSCDRRRTRGPCALFQGNWQRGEPGPAARELRPPVVQLGEGTRQTQSPSNDAGLAGSVQDPRWPHDKRRFLRVRTGANSRGNGNGSDRICGPDRNTTLLKAGIPLLADEIIDCAAMNVRQLREFYAEQMAKAKADDVLLSLHVKTTMMRVSDPVIFGHCVSVYYQDMLTKHADVLAELAVDLDNGVAELLTKIQSLREDKRAEIEADIQAVYSTRPELSMVNSSRGITNLHVPSDVIIDASMPVIIRDGGRTWGPDNELHDTIAIIPDRSYSTLYQAVIEDCQEHGAFDPSTVGSVANVGLMAQAAEEYGSHDKTFTAPGNGTIRVVDASGATLMEQNVEEGDIFRMCQTKDAAIRDWVKLGVNRARITGTPAIFWLDRNRAHDAELIKKVEQYLPEHDTTGLDIRTMAPIDAIKFAMERSRAGQDTISVTGNVLRDYLTDLFPILELGTSAKMLSVVPLLKGGGMFETGAGGSAPRHVQQFLEEGHLRWDSLGEFCALVASFEHCGEVFKNDRAKLLAETLDHAIGEHLEQRRSPSRRVNELDTRGSHFYLALYWAGMLAKQTHDPELAARFTEVAQELANNEEQIVQELIDAQGKPMDLSGYYHPNEEMAAKAMRPSATLNAIVDSI